MVSRVKTWTPEVLTDTDLNAEFDNIISALNGGQFAFPATQSASADANTLDDYEEGTFTPAIAFGGAAVGVTYGSQIGSYTKIGNRVMFEINLTLTSNGSSAGTASLTGLPFTAAAAPSSTIAAAVANVNLDVAGGYYSPYLGVASSGTTIPLQEQGDNVAFADLTEADIADTATIRCGGSYRV